MNFIMNGKAISCEHFRSMPFMLKAFHVRKKGTTTNAMTWVANCDNLCVNKLLILMDEECDGVRLPLSPLLLLFFVIASEISTWAGGRCRHVATRTRNGRDSLSSIKIPVDCHTKQINPMSLLCSRQCENIFVAQTTCENA